MSQVFLKGFRPHLRLWGTASLALAVAAIVLAAPPRPAFALSCPAKPNMPTPDGSQPQNLGVLKLQLLDYVCFGAYDRDVKRVLNEAQAYVESRAGQVSNPAIVLDVDETSLSNWPNIAADDFGFIANGPCTLAAGDPCGFNAWIASKNAKAIGPTLELVKVAHDKKIAVFFITSRNADTQKVATEQNLKSAGYPEWQGLFLKAQGQTTQEFKTASRKRISKTYTIIANVGDQQSDLDGGFAERTFRVPNPFYYLP